MKIQYDNETDTIYLQFSNDEVIESQEIKKDIIVDYNEKNEIISVEVLNVKTNSHEVDIPAILKSA